MRNLREQLDARKLMMGNMLVSSNVLKEKINRQEEQLGAELYYGGFQCIRVILSSPCVRAHLFLTEFFIILGTQESTRSLDGEKGSGYLKTLHKFLRARQQLMISQVSLLYPVKVVTGRAREQELESFTINLNSGDPSVSKPFDQDSLRIAGLHLTVIPFAKMSFFTDKKEVQRSATALGYVAHWFGLTGYHLLDSSSINEGVCADCLFLWFYFFLIKIWHFSALSIRLWTPLKVVLQLVCYYLGLSLNLSLYQFMPNSPLFLEGQDSTRTAYADLEQLLNYIGVKSLGPRHVLANLRELIKTILSHEYIET
ncbi:hypothetical protein Leryth_019101 [Lithospermum erythrorhizon]|nr:hypothetical protein Leryth_019101 [Lithospermum erythrorhizon]